MKSWTHLDGGLKLLLDMRYGRKLNSNSIRKPLVQCINGIDAERLITPMDMRSSYSTTMIRRHVMMTIFGSEICPKKNSKRCRLV